MTNTSKSKKSPKNQVVSTLVETNWNAKYYRDRAASFYNSSSYSAPSEPIAISLNKREKKALVKAGLEAASKVRHNRPANPVVEKSFVLVGGIPHKMRDGKLVPMVPAAESKKWDIIEA